MLEPLIQGEALEMSSTREAQGKPEPVFRPRRLAHANLFVSDLQRSMRFYGDVAGFHEVFDEPGIGAGFLSNGNSHHDLGLMQTYEGERVGLGGHLQVPVERGQEPGLNHLAFEMATEADVVAGYERAIARGVELHRTTDHKISRSIYLFDPEGNYLEFYCDTPDSWRDVFRKYEGQLISGEWDPTANTPSTVEYFDPDPEISSRLGAIFPSQRLARAALVVGNLAESLKFYTDVAGLRITHDRRSRSFALLSGGMGGVDLGLFDASLGADPGLHHIGFQVADLADLQAAERTLVDRQDIGISHRLDNALKASIAVEDPDGLVCEFFVERVSLASAQAAGDVLDETETSFYLI